MPKMHGSGLARSSKRIEERVATLRLTKKAPYKVKNRKHPAYRRVQDRF
jgi:hypothetical protein